MSLVGEDLDLGGLEGEVEGDLLVIMWTWGWCEPEL